MRSLPVAVVLGALGVIFALLGASGAVEPLRPGDWQMAVTLHLSHAAAMLAVALYGMATGRDVSLTGALFGVGIVLLGLGQYGVALGGARELGLLSILGGVSLLGGWGAALVQLRQPPERAE